VKDDRVYLRHILEALNAIAEYTTDGKEAFFQRRLVQDGVIRNLEIIGEAAKNVSTALRDANPDIPWQKIAGLRDVLIHQYFGVDLEAVWQMVEHRLPTLKTRILSLLD